MVLNILAVLLIVAINAFFVAAEFAIVSVRRSRIRELVSEGDRLARQVEVAQERMGRTLSGTQLGITLTSLGLGWLGEPVVASALDSLFALLPLSWRGVASHGTAITIAFGLITVLHIVLGELVPKALALVRPEAASRMLAGPLNAFNRAVSPLVWVLNGAAKLVLRGFGLSLPGTEVRAHSSDEIQGLVRHSLAEGAVEEDEEAMIQGVFELTNIVAREVMTPRPDIVALAVGASLDEVLRVATKSGHSRFPVHGDSIDEVLGVVLVKDLLRWMQGPGEEAFSLRAVMRQPYFVPDTKAVDDLLAEMRQHKVHLAVVVDEFGGTDGIVTLEDLLEEIVGEIFDEHDVPAPDVVVQEDGRILVDGGADYSDLLEEFGLGPEDPEGEYDTAAGFVMGTLGRIPEFGDRVSIGKGELEVVETTEQRVTMLELRLPTSELKGGGPVDEL